MKAMEVYVPAHAHDGVPVVVLLHGRGADRADLFSLRRFLPQEWALVAPDAPFPAAAWGYGPGRAWYRFLGRNRPEAESFQTSLDYIDDLVSNLRTAIGREPGPVALGGFSQGGTVSMGYALSHTGRVPAVLNFSGFLADHPAVMVTTKTVGDTRFFWGHGTGDPQIPFALAIEGRGLLERAGATLEAHDYDIGHSLSPEELKDAVTWLRAGQQP